jgi:hypothetical protein
MNLNGLLEKLGVDWIYHGQFFFNFFFCLFLTFFFFVDGMGWFLFPFTNLISFFSFCRVGCDGTDVLVVQPGYQLFDN